MMVEEKINNTQNNVGSQALDEKDKTIIDTAAQKAEKDIHKEERRKHFWFYVVLILIIVLIFILFVNGKEVFEVGHRLG